MRERTIDQDPRLSTRARRGLLRAGITTYQQLADLTPESLASIQNIGKKSVEEILSVQKSGPLPIQPESSRPAAVKKVSARDQRVIDSYSAGASMREIAEVHGITKQRISQIMKRHDVSIPRHRRGRRTPEKETVQQYVDALFKLGTLEKASDALGVSSDTIRRAYRRWSSNQPPNESRSIEAISALFRIRGALYMSELSSILKASEYEVKLIVPKNLHKLIIDFPQASKKRSKWSRASVIDSIRQAGTYYFPLSRKAYDQLVSIGEIEGPSSVLIFKRFGTWNELCAEAGIDSANASRYDYSRKWSQQELLSYVERFLTSDVASGSVAGYEEWSKKQVELCPSVGTLRDAFGGWREVKREALIFLRNTRLEFRADGI